MTPPPRGCQRHLIQFHPATNQTPYDFHNNQPLRPFPIYLLPPFGFAFSISPGAMTRAQAGQPLLPAPEWHFHLFRKNTTFSGAKMRQTIFRREPNAEQAIQSN